MLLVALAAIAPRLRRRDALRRRRARIPAPATSVELADFAFRPDCLSADAGATIALENTGDAPHTFTVEGTDVDVNVTPGPRARRTFGTWIRGPTP